MTADAKFINLSAWSLERIAAESTALFEACGGRPPQGFDLAAFDSRYRADHLALTSSFAAVASDGQLHGVVLAARRGRRTHISALAVAPAQQRRGVGQALVSLVLSAARERGDSSVITEVVVTNTPAVQLFEGLGFVPGRRLRGYVLSPEGPGRPNDSPIDEIDIERSAAAVAMWGDPNLPWYLHAATAFGCVAPASAFAISDSACCIVSMRAGTLVLRAVVVPPDKRRHGHASRLLDAVISANSPAAVMVPPQLHDGTGSAWLRAYGFRPLAEEQSEFGLTL